MATTRSADVGPAPRPVAVPDAVANPSISTAAGRVAPPPHIRWSGRADYDLSDRRDQISAHEQVLTEGLGQQLERHTSSRPLCSAATSSRGADVTHRAPPGGLAPVPVASAMAWCENDGIALGRGFEGVLGAAREGAEWAWELLVRDLTGSLTGFFRVRGAPDPEDLVGEVFLDVARGIHTFEGTESGFRSWVFTIAHRRLVDDRRSRVRRREEPVAVVPLGRDGSVASAEDEALERAGSDHVQHLLAALTTDQRDVLTLRVMAGLTLEETATVVDKPVSAVKALQRRALGALRREVRRRGVSR